MTPFVRAQGLSSAPTCKEEQISELRRDRSGILAGQRPPMTKSAPCPGFRSKKRGRRNIKDTHVFPLTDTRGAPLVRFPTTHARSARR